MNRTDTVLRDQNIAHDQNIPAPSPSGINSLEGSKSKNQVPVLNGIRAIACLSVLFFHIHLAVRSTGIWNPLPNIHDIDIHNVPAMLTYFAATFAYAGDSGAILFFVLSGFLLFLPYAKSLLFETPWPSLQKFYIRRIFRILPGYYVILLLIALFFHPEFLRASYWHDLWLFLTFRMDYDLSGKLNIPFWTLAIEFQFYLQLPILVWLFSLLVRRGTVHWRMLKLTLCLLLMTAWGLLTRYWGLFIADTPKLDFLIPHTVSTALKPYLYADTGKYFEVFAVGMLLCMVYTYIHNFPLAEAWHLRMQRLSSLMFTVGLAILFFLFFWRSYFLDMILSGFIHSKSYVVFTFLDPHIASIVLGYWDEWRTLAYALGFGFCVLALLYGSARLKRPFESSLLRWIASISFSLYMWHFPFVGIFTSMLGQNLRRQGWSPLVQYGALWCWTLVVIIPTSAMLYHWIEQPGIHLGEWLIHKLEKPKKGNTL